ncbi:aldo/keto reductase [Roseimaritima ulvae]|uniref:General stress protein 69 n=1 Tax=Roseimaritima ulvae TaxID=980254 RepID=A0A5B9QYB3_9BACT|nr:aldo/keto reductase [Roseimaritima ulvae]QEG42375.1 General stress protein 69 [Roseimaritima ulvae]
MTDPLRRLGQTDIEVSPVAMGCWPIAGMTSLDVNDADSLKTLRAAVDAGVNFFDTAYCYGPHGESERLIAQALGQDRQRIVLATKGGAHWNDQGERIIDGRPETLQRELEESLQRLSSTYVDLLYLHAPDPNVPIAESAGMLRRLLEAGKTRSVGVSNCNLQQVQAFAAECPLTAVQPHYNMLQREIEQDLLPWCQQHNVSTVIYWPLMKGLLAGKLPRDHVFAPGDGRAKYPMFQGEEWRKNQDFVDQLRSIAAGIDKTVAQLVVAWTIHQPGISVALCGAKRAYQIEETAGAMGWTLDAETLRRIDQALQQRGTPYSRAAIPS